MDLLRYNLEMIVTYRYRVKSKLGELNRQARAVNFVWNYCNDAQKHAVKWDQKWPTSFDLMKATAGISAELGLSANSINHVCKRYSESLRQSRKSKLRYRGNRNLGWIPLREKNIRVTDDGIRCNGIVHRLFESRPIPAGAICDGSSFSQDARGNWHLNLVIELPTNAPTALEKAIGIDLGIKDFATLSNGEKIANPKHFAALAERLGKAQRARKKRLARSLHLRITNNRNDFLHKQSTRLVREYGCIAVGDVNSSKLAKTSMAKSVLDAGWSTFRNMLRYKAITHGVWFEEVSERSSTRVCSSCGCETGPKGVADLGIRHWICSECGASHDRDTNSAINILARLGHQALVEGAGIKLPEMPITLGCVFPS